MDVRLEFTQLDPDARSNQATLELRLHNGSGKGIRLIEIHQIAPKAVNFEVARNIAKVAEVANIESRCRRVEKIFAEYIVSAVDFESDPSAGTGQDSDPISDFVEVFRERLRYVTAWWSLGLTSATRARITARKRRHVAKNVVPRFESLSDASHFGAEVLSMPTLPGAVLMQAGLRATVEQLNQVSSARPITASITDESYVPDGGTYTRVFVATCKRGFLTSRNYTVALQLHLTGHDLRNQSEAAQPVVQVTSPTQALRISPRPFPVTLVAALSGGIGSILHHAAPVLSASEGHSPVPTLKFVWSDVGIVSMILASIVFNLFEYTSLADRFSKWVDWRGALLVGVICGLGTIPMMAELERIIPSSQAATSDSRPSKNLSPPGGGSAGEVSSSESPSPGPPSSGPVPTGAKG